MLVGMIGEILLGVVRGGGIIARCFFHVCRFVINLYSNLAQPGNSHLKEDTSNGSTNISIMTGVL